ncbi:S26 family signal peptidase [Methanolapillus millepedarum]|uniref:Signal peptidase I n=1 Tax=Methanolapillus millepedarum TaxID=3028296 RepID=A0AA96VG74_9EURY|nr:hypothetical protein MsAc7_15690 [Methanosarcinaceae archaeon Ac7]
MDEKIKDFGKDILTVLAIVAAFLIFCQLVFGLWTPMYVVQSGSMEPHMNIGDIIFIKDIDRVTVQTNEQALSSANPKMKFGGYGDVILYRPNGSKTAVPIIHRAMYYVEKGEPMWEGGPAAPHAGYMTKGDNPFTNPLLDQQTQISYNTPVKEEWVIGISKYRIPYIGKIRLIFS